MSSSILVWLTPEYFSRQGWSLGYKGFKEINCEMNTNVVQTTPQVIRRKPNVTWNMKKCTFDKTRSECSGR